jgi:hypothetical protein
MIIIQAQPVLEITPVNKQEEITKEIEEKNITLQSDRDKPREEADLKLKMKPPLNLDENKGKIIDVTG